MNYILKQLECLAAFVSKNLSVLIIVSGLLVVALIGVDATYGLTESLQGKLPKTVGKFFGKIGLAFAEVAIAYYLLREAYVFMKKRGVALPGALDSGVKSLLNITRYIHPYAGFLVICAVMLHGYMMVFVWLSAKGAWAVWSGAVSLISLASLGVIGWLIRLNQPALLLRKYHRYAGFLFFGLFFLHKAIAD